AISRWCRRKKATSKHSAAAASAGTGTCGTISSARASRCSSAPADARCGCGCSRGRATATPRRSWRATGFSGRVGRGGASLRQLQAAELARLDFVLAVVAGERPARHRRQVAQAGDAVVAIAALRLAEAIGDEQARDAVIVAGEEDELVAHGVVVDLPDTREAV